VVLTSCAVIKALGPGLSVRAPYSNSTSPVGVSTRRDWIQPPLSLFPSWIVIWLLGNSLATKYALASPEMPPPSTATFSGYACDEAYRRQRVHSEETAGRRATRFNVDSMSGACFRSRIAVCEGLRVWECGPWILCQSFLHDVRQSRARAALLCYGTSPTLLQLHIQRHSKQCARGYITKSAALQPPENVSLHFKKSHHICSPSMQIKPCHPSPNAVPSVS
jgi:hypothetical protein